MTGHHPLSADANNKFEDLSGVTEVFPNPYDALIEACQHDPLQIQARYALHRTARNEQQKANLLSPSFKGLLTDGILQRLEDPTLEPGFVDPRHGIVFWARPPPHIRCLIEQIQQRLKITAPNLWTMPIECCHMTAMEICHSRTPEDVASLIAQMSPSIPALTDCTYANRSRLIKPLVSYDGAAIALSFLPASGEALSSGRSADDDKFTYHHLRRDMHAASRETGVEIGTRYIVPSAHVTMGRFVTQVDHDTPDKMVLWIAEIEKINEWLVHEFWPQKDVTDELESIKEGGEWIVGQGVGLDCRTGALWYGGGRTVRLGKGF
ncbi:MAG: hypothetical protein M1818_002747 [Claussenomyces sp. TS43310]|nr:MAG: hypothetical protein M1818_002747 [Claussenomyces sp. TS43310]